MPAIRYGYTVVRECAGEPGHETLGLRVFDDEARAGAIVAVDGRRCWVVSVESDLGELVVRDTCSKCHDEPVRALGQRLGPRCHAAAAPGFNLKSEI